MNRPFLNRDLISIQDLSKDEICHVLETAKHLKQKRYPQLMQGAILGTCFFEPSTRTRLSFESAMYRLGGTVVGFADGQTTSAKKGETLYDSMKMIGHYADVIVVRHSLEGSAQQAADAVEIPVINAGDGTNQHPTQTLLDLFSILECQGKLDKLNIALVGDLKYGRTVHSLAHACAHFNHRLYFISPPSLEMPKEICDELRDKQIKFTYHKDIDEVIDKVDVLYMTRIQEERFPHKLEYELVKNSTILKPEHLKRAKKNLRVLHPFPRLNEIDREIDKTPHAYYFEQAQNGLFARQALLALLLGKI